MDRILILGSGRSGTTWVQDCIANANGLSTAFEPLNPEISLVASKYAFRHLEESDIAIDLYEYLTSEPVGIREAAWINYRVNLRDLCLSRTDLLRPQAYRRLIRRYRNSFQTYAQLRDVRQRNPKVLKLIRAHFMIAWLKKNISSKIIYIIRNPIQVVSSQNARGDSWLPDRRIDLIMRNSCLSKNYANLLQFYNRPNTTKLEKLSIIWIIENCSALATCIEKDIAYYWYEDLRNGDDSSWKSLCKDAGLNKIPSSALRKVPSSMALPLTGQAKLSNKSKNEIQNVLRIFASSLKEYKLPSNLKNGVTSIWG